MQSIFHLGFVKQHLVNDLLRECTRMHNFEHPNVLKLSGVCLDGGPAPYIIMPFMENGCLLSYLRKYRASLVLDPDVVDNEVKDHVLLSGCSTMSFLKQEGIVHKKLMDMSIQVGKGMEYLTSKRVIHRDLAARNCMYDQYNQLMLILLIVFIF